MDSVQESDLAPFGGRFKRKWKKKSEIKPPSMICFHDIVGTKNKILNSMVQSHSPNISALDICNSPVWNIEFDELDFFPSFCLMQPVKFKFEID